MTESKKSKDSKSTKSSGASKATGKYTNRITLKVLSVIQEAQLAHGLRHNDYQLYRQYCTRKLRRLRKNLGVIQGDRKTFRKKKVTTQMLKQTRMIYIPLVTVERCWAYAMQLKEESMEDSRKKFRMRNRLRKAEKNVVEFERIVEESDVCDARTKLEVKGYSAWLQGTVLFELAESTGMWEQPMAFFETAHAIYSKLKNTVSDDEAEMYENKLHELDVKLRYCKHHLGDKAATSKLLDMNDSAGLGDKLDRLVIAAREHQASTLSEVSWKGRTLAVKHKKVRMFLLNERLVHGKLLKCGTSDEKTAMLDGLLMECKDALQLVREDLKNDSTFKPRQQASKGPTSSLHFLHTYLSYLRLQLTNQRNWELFYTYRDIISGKKKLDQNRKAPKFQDIMRFCELSLQNLTEMIQLAGLEDDLELKNESEGLTFFYNAFRDFYAAESYVSMKKYQEAFAIYERCAQHIGNARKCDIKPEFIQDLDSLETDVESKKFTAHAQLFTSAPTPESTDCIEELSKKLLIERLDEYYEDPSLLSGAPKVAPVPPAMVPVPCKPILFDLAYNYCEFPLLEEKATPDSPAKSQPGGIRGLVQGLWGWGS